MMKTILLSILIFAFQSIRAQDSCSCEKVFAEIAQKVESNYLGLKQLVLAGNDGDYQKRKVEFTTKSTSVSASNCTAFSQEFLRYFDDGHLFVFERPKYSDQEKLAFKSKVQQAAIDPTTLTNMLTDQLKQRNETLVGKWTDGSSVYIVVKEREQFNAYLLSSSEEFSFRPGQLKAQFKLDTQGVNGTYYSSSYSPRYIAGNIYKEGTLLAFDGGLYWGKLESPFTREVNMINRENITLPTITKLDDKTTLLSIPSFLPESQPFFKVLEDNYELLSNTVDLIIDIRGNTGGNSLYHSFLDWFATKDLDESQGLVLASEDTKIYFEKQAKYAKDIFQPVVQRIEKTPGSIVDGPLFPAKKIKPLTIKIQKVAILTDNGCMSAAESFVLHAKNVSSKVTTFGSPTAGVIDYTSVNTILLATSGNQTIYFGYPTSSWNKEIPENGYNKTGIIPDVPIDPSVKDKVGWIMKFWNE